MISILYINLHEINVNVTIETVQRQIYKHANMLTNCH